MIVEQYKAIIECYATPDKEFSGAFIDKDLVNAFAYLRGVPIITGCIAAAFI